MAINPQPTFINGYSTIADTYKGGLDSISATLAGIGPTPAVQDLNNALVSFLVTSYYNDASYKTTLDWQQQLQAVVGNVFNAYIGPDNPIALPFTDGQICMIKEIIKNIKALSINQNSGDNYFQLAQEAVATSDMNTYEQAPLLMALAITSEAYDYFYGEILSPDANWSVFIDANPAVNFSNLANWTIAAFRGALIGATQSMPVMPTIAPQGVGVLSNIITAIGGALTVTFGEIVFNWVQRPQVRVCS